MPQVPKAVSGGPGPKAAEGLRLWPGELAISTPKTMPEARGSGQGRTDEFSAFHLCLPLDGFHTKACQRYTDLLRYAVHCIVIVVERLGIPKVARSGER